MLIGAKIERGSWVWAGKLSFFGFSRDRRPCTTARRLGTEHDVGAHTDVGGDCADAIEAGVGANGLAQPLSRTRVRFARLY